MNLEFLKHWKVFKDKGPVNVPGAQANYQKASVHVLPHLTETERRQLQIAHGHATSVSGETRQEWDSVCRQIETRLGVD